MTKYGKDDDMETVSGAPILICDTVLRDMHRTQAAAMLSGEDAYPALSALNEAGYFALECWSDATLDYWTIREGADGDPWRMLRLMREALSQTRLQMMLRTKKLPYDAQDAIDALDDYCLTAIENGVDIFRIYDADNDAARLERVMKTVKKYGATIEGAFCYRKDAANGQTATALAKRMCDMGADIVSIMDLSCAMTPSDAYETVRDVKRAVKVPVDLRVRHADGQGVKHLQRAVEAGVDIVDTSLGLFADRFSQPMTESVVRAMRASDRDPALDMSEIKKASERFLKAADESATYEEQLRLTS